MWQHNDEAEVDNASLQHWHIWLMQQPALPGVRPEGQAFDRVWRGNAHKKCERTDRYPDCRKVHMLETAAFRIHSMHASNLWADCKNTTTIILQSIWDSANEICFPGYPSGMLHVVSLFSSHCRGTFRLLQFSVTNSIKRLVRVPEQFQRKEGSKTSTRGPQSSEGHLRSPGLCDALSKDLDVHLLCVTLAFWGLFLSIILVKWRMTGSREKNGTETRVDHKWIKR